MIDLHAHTTISDGTYTPTELIRLAKEMNLNAIAITDHDNIEGHEEASLEAEKLGVNLVKGIEFDVIYKNEYRMHILGLNIDGMNEEFLKIYTKYRQGKEAQVPYVLEKLSELGVDISIKDIKPYMSGGYLDRQAIAKYLVDMGFTPLMKFSWINYLDKIPMIEGELIHVEDAIKAIRLAGGKSFMAHYHLNLGLNRFSDEEKLDVLGEFKAFGLNGMEYYYPTFTLEQQAQCKHWVDKFNFDICGGSDFHGLNRINIQLGIGEGEFCVPDSVLDYIV